MVAWDLLGLTLQFFTYLSPYQLGLVHGINQVIFLYAFAYSHVRGRVPHPAQTAAEVAIYTEVVALMCAFAQVPLMLTGIIVIIAYSLIMRHFRKFKFRVWIESFISLWILVGILAIAGDFLGSLFTLFAVAFFFVQSEMKVRDYDSVKEEKIIPSGKKAEEKKK